jgi:hypothetical protein
MRVSWKWTVVLAVALAVPALCAADQPAERAAPTPTTVNLMLLRQKSVQSDLKIDAELGKKIVDFTNKEFEAWKEAQNLGEADRERKIQELRSANEKFLADNLSEAQRKRLDQIRWQVTGLQQLNTPEVAKLLNLTAEQQTKFKELRDEARTQLEQIFDPKNRESRTEMLKKFREETDKKVEAVLTDEQKAKAREMVGEPFNGELSFEGPE